MADGTWSPLSAVLLGVNVCKDLLTLVSDYKGQDAEIEQTTEKIERLKKSLEEIQALLPKDRSLAATTDHIERCIKSSVKGIEQLRKFLEKYSKPQSASSLLVAHNSSKAKPALKDKARTRIRRLTFPLQSASLRELKCILKNLQEDLDTSFTVLNLGVTSTALSTTLDINVRTQSMEGQLNSIMSQLMLINTKQPSIHSPPSESLSGDESIIDQTLTLPLPIGIPFCSCQPRFQYNYLQFHRGQARLYRESLSRRLHSKSCPFSSTPTKTGTIGIDVVLSTLLIRGIFSASISAILSTRGYSIFPRLNFCVTMLDSPAFQLLRTLSRCVIGPDADTVSLMADDKVGIRNKMTETQLALHKLFTERRASPCDRDINGNTILHKCIRLYSLSSHFGIPGSSEHFRDLITYICQALQSTGGSLNEPNIRGEFPLDMLVYSRIRLRRCSSPFISLTLAMLENGATFSDGWIYRSKYMHSNFVEFIIQCPWVIDEVPDSSFGPLSQAVIKRSLPLVEKILQITQATCVERNAQGQTPLHLAAGWPQGAFVLVKAMPHLVNVGDSLNNLPIDYACYFQNTEVVRMLIEADAQINHHVWNHQSFFYLSESIIRLMVQGLSIRRQRLREFAAKHISAISMSNLSSDRVLDADLGGVIESLSSLRIEIPEPLRPYQKYGETLYHRLGYALKSFDAIKVAEIFLANSFLDLDASNSAGVTPIMAMHESGHKMFTSTDIRYITWLVRKGARLSRMPQQTLTETSRAPPRVLHVTACHYVARRLALGFRLHFWGGFDPQCLSTQLTLLNEATPLLRTVFLRNYHDNCICACNHQGCQPITIFLRMVYDPYEESDCSRAPLGRTVWPQVPPRRQLIESIWPTVMRCLAGAGEQHLTWLALAFIRLQTFRKLEIAHTCCLPGRQIVLAERAFASRDPDEIKELQDEDKSKIKLLETLMVEFEENLIVKNLTLRTFMKEYWIPRIKQVLREQREEGLSENSRQQLEDLGVVLEASGNEQIDTLSDDNDGWEDYGSDMDDVDMVEEILADV